MNSLHSTRIAPTAQQGSILTHWLSGLPRNTARAYARDIADFAAFLTGGLDTLHVMHGGELYKVGARFVAHLSSKSTATVNRKISAVRSYLDFLCGIGKITENPLRYVRTPKVVNRTRDTISTSETERMLSTIDLTTPGGKRDHALLLILLQLGMRRAEVVTLKVGDFQEISEGIQIVAFIGKGGKRRRLPISQSIASALREHFAAAGIDRGNPDQPAFPNIEGRPISTNLLYKIICKYAEAAGIRKTLSPHTFRHYAITEAVKVEPNILKVREFSGHASTATLSRYTHLRTIDEVREIQAKRGIR